MTELQRAVQQCDGATYSLERANYERQPQAIKDKYTWREWQWLGTERDRAVDRETMPDGPAE
jgi:hypothetical protein